MLEKIMQTRVKLLGDAHIATGEVKYTIGLLYLFLGEKDKANQLVGMASAIYKDKLGESHPSTIDVATVADSIKQEATNAAATAGTGGVPIGIHSGGVEAMEGFDQLINQFPENMPRAATQSPIPLPPNSRQSTTGFDDSMRMTPSGSRGRL